MGIFTQVKGSCLDRILTVDMKVTHKTVQPVPIIQQNLHFGSRWGDPATIAFITWQLPTDAHRCPLLPRKISPKPTMKSVRLPFHLTARYCVLSLSDLSYPPAEASVCLSLCDYLKGHLRFLSYPREICCADRHIYEALAIATQWHCTAIVIIDQKNRIDIAMIMRLLHCPC